MPSLILLWITKYKQETAKDDMVLQTGVKLSARPLALATISLVWAHEIIKAFTHLATVNLLSCKRFISLFNLSPLTYIVDPFYLGALFRQHWFCTRSGGKLTTWVEKFKCLDIGLSINSGMDLGKKIYRVWRNFKLSIKWKVYLEPLASHFVVFNCIASNLTLRYAVTLKKTICFCNESIECTP